MTEVRNQYGFPIVDKVQQARLYAAEAKQRNQAPCKCQACVQVEMLPAVIQLVNNWSNK